jgi:hypothetical protein
MCSSPAFFNMAPNRRVTFRGSKGVPMEVANTKAITLSLRACMLRFKVLAVTLGV